MIETALAVQLAERSLSHFSLRGLSSKNYVKTLRGVGGLRHALTFHRVKRRYAQASITEIICVSLGYIVWNADDTTWNTSMLQPIPTIFQTGRIF